jgi:hypothetical protein
MMDANTELLLEVFRAVQERHDAALFRRYDPAVEFHETPTLPYGGTHHGFEAVMRAQMFHYDAAAVASFLENASRADDD